MRAGKVGKKESVQMDNRHFTSASPPTRVLLVEDDPDHQALVKMALQEAGSFDLQIARTGTEALERLTADGYDALLLDYHLPDMEAPLLWQEAQRRGIDLPSVILTSVPTVETAVSAMKAGVQDYVVKSNDGFLRLPETLREAIQQHEMDRSQRNRERQLEEEARIDFLTGLYNHRYFDERLTAEVERARRYRRPLTVVMMDFDNMKAINDTLGHMVGNQMLIVMADLIRKTVRSVDIAARYGGDEFVIAAPEVGDEQDPTSAQELVRRLRHGIDELNRSGRLPAQLSVSIGMSRSVGSAEAMLCAADEAMYQDKRRRKSGRVR